MLNDLLIMLLNKSLTPDHLHCITHLHVSVCERVYQDEGGTLVLAVFEPLGLPQGGDG